MKLNFHNCDNVTLLCCGNETLQFYDLQRSYRNMCGVTTAVVVLKKKTTALST